MKISESHCRKDPLGFFNIHSVAEHQKIEEDPLRNFFPKKSLNAEKNKGPFSLSRYCMLRGKRGKTFLVPFLVPNGPI